ncbi:hypothetical protein Bhyg_06593 [Pseudolycoriella hygida]|uniref:Uncharacterized protein n=1 Tax=Pseudolycoriella hygida TaxID=35572 RepID=A0A9Q0S2K5_9DIPT|nr:hypothetical protein Bhyg_06593 [Pseudolycoriella hygida]
MRLSAFLIVTAIFACQAVAHNVSCEVKERLVPVTTEHLTYHEVMASSEQQDVFNKTKNRYTVVEQLNAGYDKFFEGKQQKTSEISGGCYSSYYKKCEKAAPKQCFKVKEEKNVDEKNSLPASNQNLTQQFFPQQRQETKKQVSGSGCCKYLVTKCEK